MASLAFPVIGCHFGAPSQGLAGHALQQLEQQTIFLGFASEQAVSFNMLHKIEMGKFVFTSF